MKKKVIKLSEADLNRIVKRVIMEENSITELFGFGGKSKPEREPDNELRDFQKEFDVAAEKAGLSDKIKKGKAEEFGNYTQIKIIDINSPGSKTPMAVVRLITNGDIVLTNFLTRNSDKNKFNHVDNAMEHMANYLRKNR